MRRGILFIFTLPLMLAGLVLAAPAALAQNAHFISARLSVLAATGPWPGWAGPAPRNPIMPT